MLIIFSYQGLYSRIKNLLQEFEHFNFSTIVMMILLDEIINCYCFGLLSWKISVLQSLFEGKFTVNEFIPIDFDLEFIIVQYYGFLEDIINKVIKFKNKKVY